MPWVSITFYCETNCPQTYWFNFKPNFSLVYGFVDGLLGLASIAWPRRSKMVWFTHLMVGRLVCLRGHTLMSGSCLDVSWGDDYMSFIIYHVSESFPQGGERVLSSKREQAIIVSTF